MQRFPITVQSQSTRLAAVKPLTLGKPGAFLYPIIGKGLAVLNDEEKLREAAPAQITTALGTLIDKWAAVSGSAADEIKEDGLSKSLREMAEELESDG